MPAKIIFSDDVESYVQANYENLGPLKVSKNLGLGYDIVRRCARQLKIKYKARKYEINYDQFIPICDAESAYTLGFLWADGSLFGKEGSYSRRVSLAFIEDDYHDIKNALLKNINWQVSFQERLNRRRKAYLHFYDNRLGNWFYSVGFKQKSFTSPILLLEQIPDELKHYFWRGYFDGDGNIHITKTNTTLKITSSYSQDWSSTEDLFKSIGIKNFSIRRDIGKSGKHSNILIYNLSDILKFLIYIYKDYNNDKIGLTRKYNKYLELVNRKVRHKRLKSLLSTIDV